MISMNGWFVCASTLLSLCFYFIPSDRRVYSRLRLGDKRAHQQLHDHPSGATSSAQQV